MKNLMTFLLLALFLTACSKNEDPPAPVDPCANINCANGGVCNNGICDCPDGYEGAACTLESTPMSMQAVTFELTDMSPSNPDGSNWDVFDGPDVYYVIRKDNEILYTSPFREDSFTASWTQAFAFNDPADIYDFLVYDYDDGLSTDDFIGGISFSPYRANQGFPESIVLSCDDCTITARISGLVYLF